MGAAGGAAPCSERRQGLGQIPRGKEAVILSPPSAKQRLHLSSLPHSCSFLSSRLFLAAFLPRAASAREGSAAGTPDARSFFRRWKSHARASCRIRPKGRGRLTWAAPQPGRHAGRLADRQASRPEDRPRRRREPCPPCARPGASGGPRDGPQVPPSPAVRAWGVACLRLSRFRAFYLWPRVVLCCLPRKIPQCVPGHNILFSDVTCEAGRRARWRRRRRRRSVIALARLVCVCVHLCACAPVCVRVLESPQLPGFNSSGFISPGSITDSLQGQPQGEEGLLAPPPCLPEEEEGRRA